MSDNSARATARFVRVTPMKARRVINLVRGKSVEEALAILKYAPQDASVPVAKVVQSAAANAENNNGHSRSVSAPATSLWLSRARRQVHNSGPKNSPTRPPIGHYFRLEVPLVRR